MKKMTRTEIGFHEVDDLVNKHLPELGGDYECSAGEELSNYDRRPYDVSAEEYDAGDWQRCLGNRHPNCAWLGFQWNLGLILNRLCRDGFLEPGDYLLEVSY